MRFRPPGECPVCGDDVPAGAPACPECGACEHSGWNEDEVDDEETFDYDEFVREEFGQQPRIRIHPLWWVAAVIILIAFATRMLNFW